jgi:hypothetical protein
MPHRILTHSGGFERIFGGAQLEKIRAIQLPKKIQKRNQKKLKSNKKQIFRLVIRVILTV